MNLELNLVKVDNIYAQASKILARSRSLVGNDTEAMAQIIKFINDNIDYINSAITDKSLVNQLTNLKSLSIDELQSLKYILAESGLDIQYWTVADIEDNEKGIPDKMIEYNIIDLTNYSSNFIPFCTKITVNADTYTISSVYAKIVEIYNLFKGNLFTDRINPITSDIKVIEDQENVLGSVPITVTTHINSILEFLGKKLYAILN